MKPSSKDPVFADRPSPSRDFNVPVHCVGDLLRVWDFCNSFGRLLHLSPYSLEDFENSVCHKESTVALLVESHSSLLRVLMDDGGDYASAVEKRRQRSCKVNQVLAAISLYFILFYVRYTFPLKLPLHLVFYSNFFCFFVSDMTVSNTISFSDYKD